MKGTRHSEEQIIAILKQGEAGLATSELCRQHGISEQTYYLESEVRRHGSGDVKKLRQLDDDGLIDNTHPPAAQLLNDAVVGDRLADHRVEILGP